MRSCMANLAVARADITQTCAFFLDIDFSARHLSYTGLCNQGRRPMRRNILRSTALLLFGLTLLPSSAASEPVGRGIIRLYALEYPSIRVIGFFDLEMDASDASKFLVPHDLVAICSPMNYSDDRHLVLVSTACQIIHHCSSNGAVVGASAEKLL